MPLPLAVRRVLAACLIALAALLGGCASTTSAGTVASGRKQLLLVSSDQMNQIAAQTYTKLKAQATAQGKLDRDPALLPQVMPLYQAAKR